MAVRDHFRAHARRRIELGAALKGPEGGPPQPVRIRDLGLGGVGLELPEAMPAWAGGLDRDAPVTVELTAPSLWDPLVVRGTIAWIKRGSQGRATRAGVRFEHIESAALFALFQLLGAPGNEG